MFLAQINSFNGFCDLYFSIFARLGFEPAYRRHHSEEPVSQAAALAAAMPTGLPCTSLGGVRR